MIRIEMQISNEGARAAQREIKYFLAICTEKISGARYDRHDTATPAYVVLRSFLEKLEHEIARQDKHEADLKAALKPKRPTVRESRG